MQFSLLNISQNVLDAIQKLHYKEMTPIQEQVIPHLLKDCDVLAQAETGSGKTAAFVIPIVEHCILEENCVQSLILTPTRELAIQVQEDCENIGAYKRLRSISVYGKSSYQFQKEALKQRVHIVVGTPGRILEHLKNGTIDLSKIRHLVIDEADEMLKLGLLETLKQIMTYIPKCNISLFSATLQEHIMSFADTYMNEPQTIRLSSASAVKKTMDHYGYDVENENKPVFLLKLLCQKQSEACMVFARTQEGVEQVAAYLDEQGILVDMIHGGMVQEDRVENMEDFKRGKLRVLVATDVASRGIDVEKVDLIVNYDVPAQSEAYIHRLGRSARKNESGCAITLVDSNEKWRLDKLNEYLSEPLEMKDAQVISTYEIDEKGLKALGKPLAFKQKKGKDVHADTMKIYINAGKSKKVRAGDIVGAICEIEGVSGDDIGVIAIQEHQSFVDILNGKGKLVLQHLKRIKKKNVKVQKAK